MTRKTLNRLAVRLHRVVVAKSQRILAEEIHRSQSWLSRVERGGPAVITDEDLSGLAAALRVETSDLEGR